MSSRAATPLQASHNYSFGKGVFRFIDKWSGVGRDLSRMSDLGLQIIKTKVKKCLNNNNEII